MTIKQKISPCLWFDTQAEEAAKFYTSVFKNSKITGTIPGPDGKPIVVTFVLDGVEVQALNGGPSFDFNEAVSLFVYCETQTEVDDLWSKLTAEGGEESMCGWRKTSMACRGRLYRLLSVNCSHTLTVKRQAAQCRR